MTLISALKFNDNEGAIIADERSSSQIRNFDVAQKLNVMNDKQNAYTLLYGGSGAADVIYGISANHLKQSYPSVQDAMRGLSKSILDEKRRIQDAYLLANFNVTLEDLQRGFRLVNGERIDLQDKEKIFAALNNQLGQMLDFGFLALAKDKQGAGIYRLRSGLAVPETVARPYECTGSGSDMADTVLSEYFEQKPRESWNNVPPIEGVALLLNALGKASQRNVGVGGTPSLYVIRDDKVYAPAEGEMRLASELVRASEKGLLTKEFSREGLDALVFQSAAYGDVNKQMLAQATNPEALQLFLRGYK
ncbi:MAG: hypothetical protein V1725_07530 [archaeon]